MKIINAKICSSGKLYSGEIDIQGEYIAKGCADNDADILDVQGMYVIPGLLDVHFHGCAGYDLCDGSREAIEAIARYQGENGVLEICPATMTYPEHILTPVMESVAAYQSEEGADLVGIHLEGPFISPNKIGAQNAEYVQKPDAEMLLRLQEKANGMIRICDVAPEEEHALEFIDQIKDHVAAVSIAHTCCDYDTAMQAYAHGAKHLTHGFNAMPGLHHRVPGPLAAALDSGADVELICDGMHIHPAMIRMAFRTFGADHIVMISDTLRSCGLGEGEYDLGGQTIIVKGRIGVLKDNPSVIACGVSNLMQCLRCTVKDAGIPLEDAVMAATHNPARSIGVDQYYGDIQEGKYANLVVLNSDLEIVHIIKRGKLIR